MEAGKSYICIDLKSFYASVECVERGLDPMTAKLVVADPTRTEKTVCLAVSPALKALGVKNRCRVFQIPPNLEYIMAQPRMALYIEYAARIYEIYLKYVAREDIHVYSIDEAFLDITNYLSLRQQTAKEFAKMILEDIFKSLGLTATCGMGTNMYLAKIALDILAKHAPDYIAELSEETYRQRLWKHRPLTDFWRVGRGTAARLERLGILDMGELAQADEEVLYKSFGIDAELLIDHAWGREPTTIADIKAYVPQESSLSSGQVLTRGYDYKETRIIVREMAEQMALDLFDKGLVTSSIGLHLGYSYSSGRASTNGSMALEAATSSVKKIAQCAENVYDRIADKGAMVHRVAISLNKLESESFQQYDMFSTPESQERERKLQTAMLDIKKKYGKNGIVKCMDLLDEATMMERNRQIGGHKA